MRERGIGEALTDLKAVEARLTAAMHSGLPGPAAQLRMAPRPRPGWVPGRIPEGCRESAALLLLFPAGGRAHLVLTVRARDLANHGGQVSLPGGAVEPGEVPSRAALREAEEEIALDREAARLIGELTPIHIPVSCYLLHPFVAVAGRRPVLRCRQEEVARILTVSLGHLADPAHLRVGPWRKDGVTYRVPYFDVEGERVWGATAMILSEFLTILGHPPRPGGVGHHG